VIDGEITDLLRAGAAAPSSHNTQPWHLDWVDDAVEVRGDPDRVLPVSDPDARELRVACGAAVANVRLAIRAQGRRAHASLLPDAADPWFYARIRPGSAWPAAPWERELATAIHHRRTNRRSFFPPPVSRRDRYDLIRAVERERCWLVYLDEPADRRRLRDVTIAAHRQQRSDPAFLREWEHWVGHPDRSSDGIPAALSRLAPHPDDSWRVRDFGPPVTTAGDRPANVQATGTRPVDDVEEAPTLAVVATVLDEPRSHLEAGVAMEQVLLTATARGLSASFVASPLEVPERRDEVRALLGGGLWPQAILRLGRGVPVPAMPRRSETSGRFSGNRRS